MFDDPVRTLALRIANAGGGGDAGHDHRHLLIRKNAGQRLNGRSLFAKLACLFLRTFAIKKSESSNRLGGLQDSGVGPKQKL